MNEEKKYTQEERDNYAISFACWVISPEGEMYRATGMSALKLLRTYQDRPYINTDPSQQ